MSLASSLTAAPMLKSGVLHAQVEAGTYVELGERSFFVRGEKLFPIVSRILHSLDGSRALDEIRASLPEKVVPLLDQLLDHLVRQRMLTSGPPEAIPDDHPHASTLGFFRDATSRWRECFEEWSQVRITLMGSPELVPALARAIVSAAAGRVAIIQLDAVDPEAVGPEMGDSATHDARNTGPGNLHGQPQIDERSPPAAGLPSVCEVLAFTAAMRQPREPRSLLLYLGAEPPDEDALGRIEALASRHEVTMIGAVCGDIGIVGPDCRNGLAPWRGLVSRARGQAQPFTRAAMRVLASLLAFEAMQERIAAWSDDPQESARRETQFRVVRNDGSVSSHDSEVFLASGRSLVNDVPDEPVVAPTDPSLTRFFDPAAGLFSDATVPGPEYPLAHRAVALSYASPGGEARQQTLYDWGLDPAGAEQRLMAQAFAALVAGNTGHVAAPGVSLLIASPSEEASRAIAMSCARATLPDFLRDHLPQARAIATTDSPDVQVLARLIRLYSGRLPLLWTAGSAGAAGSTESGACIAWANIGDWTAVAVAPDLQAAIFEALGETLSAFQLGRLTDRQSIWPLSELRCVALPREAGDGNDPPPAPAIEAPVALQYVAATDPCLPAGMHVGHARTLRA